MKQLDPTPAAVALWLKQLDRGTLHGKGWIKINRRFHGITRAIRPFMHNQFSDPKEQEAAFDGLTLALLTMAHFEDIATLQRLLGTIQTKPKKRRTAKE